MVFNTNKCKILTPEYINTALALDLHRFAWVQTRDIGSLPLEWNWLVGEYGYDPSYDVPWYTQVGGVDYFTAKPRKIFHYTLGGPWFRDYQGCDHAKEWFKELDLAFPSLNVRDTAQVE
jgi:hypothetical protein